MNELGQRIKQARSEKGLTQAQLAEEIHVTRQTISNWENGRSIPDYVMLGRLAKVLPLDVGIATLADVPAREEPKEAPQEEQAPPEVPQTKDTNFHVPWRMLCAASAALLIVVVLAVCWLFPAKKETYTLDWFLQAQTAEEGKTFVRTYSPEAPIKARHNRQEATPIYQFSVFMKEENGVGCTIEDVTLVYFSGKKVTLVDSLAQEDFLFINLGSSYLGANQCRRMALNFPAENETGIGFWISGIDDNGHEFESRCYLPLTKE